ncbi:MAG: 2-phosphosulfolactate phosphatase [Bacteroidota bacterium]|nr:2-phosphosulfolactate phosphatase [Bacteroidota bacterium]
MCFSPGLLPCYDLEDKAVVIIDIFRASSAICTALSHGVREIIPVMHVSEALEYKERGFYVAAERHGEVVDGFDLGNSPYAFMDPKFKDQAIVLTTTNCTKAIHHASDARHIIIASFLNLTAVADYLKSMDEDIVLLCAGWKNRFNLEDSIFAGALTQMMGSHVNPECDSAVAAMQLYDLAKNDLRKFLKQSSHNQRMEYLQIEDDIQFCLKQDLYTTIPRFNGVSLQPIESVTA